MRALSALGLVSLLAGSVSCAALAGLEDDYSIGGGGAGTTGTGTTTTGTTGTGTAGTTTGTGTGTGTAGAGGSTPAGTPGGTGAGGGSTGGGGTGGTSPTWQLVDTLVVPTDGSDVTSGYVLQNGVTYRLRASGTFDCTGNGTVCDAEYVYRPPEDDMAGTVDFGIGINDPIVDGTTPPDWGAYTSTHIYEVSWDGTGAVITAKLHDPNYGNNSGGPLTVEILALQ